MHLNIEESPASWVVKLFGEVGGGVPVGGGGGGGMGGVCRQNICYHVAAYLIPFNLICNMTMF